MDGALAVSIVWFDSDGNNGHRMEYCGSYYHSIKYCHGFFFIFSGAGVLILGGIVFIWTLIAIILFPVIFPLVIPLLVILLFIGLFF